MSFKNLETRKVYNDVIDEAYELEEDEILEERKIENDTVDGEINVSDDSENYIPTPREDDLDEDDEERANMTQRVYEEKEAYTEGSELEFGNGNLKKNLAKTSEKDIENLNLDQHTKDLFKYIKVWKFLN